MTREEASNRLKQWIRNGCDGMTDERLGYIEGWFHKSDKEAFEQAIKALEQEPCEDCRNCKKWDDCECGRKGHINGTSIGHSIGKCKDYEPSGDLKDVRLLESHEIYDGQGFTEVVYKDDIDNLPSVNPQEPMREFTEEEAKAYSKALDKMYKPIGINVFEEPSGDLISRQAVLKQLKGCLTGGETEYNYVKIHIDSIPSVKQERTGHWIVHPKGIYAHLVCNKCLSSAPYDCQTNYCPNCGAKMERSDKE